MRPVPSVFSSYRDPTKLPIKVFFISVTFDDNETSTRRPRDMLEDKGYEMHHVEVPQEHNGQSWKPLLDDVLRYFYSS